MAQAWADDIEDQAAHESESLSRHCWYAPKQRKPNIFGTSSAAEAAGNSSSGVVTPTSCFKDITSSSQSATLVSSEGWPLAHPQANRQRRASMQEAIDFRKINSKLYDGTLLQRQLSVGNVEENPLGSLKFSVYFNEGANVLTIYLISAQNLFPTELSETFDPYCKLCILPDHRQQLQSKIHRKTANPQFNEEFVFEVHKDKLDKMALLIVVYNCDDCTRHECIGQVKLPLTNIAFNQQKVMCMPLSQGEEESCQDNGDLIFSIGYLSSAERLTVVVMKARNLRQPEDGKTTIDPYVKALVNYGVGKKGKKKKTSTKHNVNTPVWNEALNFKLPKHYLQTVSLELLVCHDNKLGTDETLGRIKISRDSSGDERIHWDEVVSGRSAVARWHSLTS